MKNIKIGIYTVITGSLLSLTGCFNLDETVFSEVTENSFIPTNKDVAALMASAYSPLNYIYNWQGYFDLQEEPADVIITPTRPNGWDDGGTYRRMHLHTWTPESWQPRNTYLTAYSGINSANRVKDQIESDQLPVGDKKDAIIAELRAIRALWYSILLDSHGNVPIVTQFTDEIPKQSKRQEVYDFIVKELNDVLPDLSEENNSVTYGRMNKWAAYMTLARVYLNAEVYTGTAQWQNALNCVNEVINSGIFSLSSDYSDNFTPEADFNNKEFIFAVPYDSKYSAFGQHHKWYPSIAKEHFGNKSDYFWGGSCANPQFINSYEPGDKRLEKSWLIGPQYRADDPNVLVWTCLNYLPSLTCMKDGKDYTSIDYGYRVMKFGYNYDSNTGGWSNDFAYYRYAETLMIKAECLLRLNQNESEAANLISQIRSRAFDDASLANVTVEDLKKDTRIKYGTLNWDNEIDNPGDQSPVILGGLYDEWGIEFVCEAQRRTQMIRFGTYSTKSWFNHEAVKDGHTALFPIPLAELQANENLKQNPGY